MIRPPVDVRTAFLLSIFGLLTYTPAATAGQIINPTSPTNSCVNRGGTINLQNLFPYLDGGSMGFENGDPNQSPPIDPYPEVVRDASYTPYIPYTPSVTRDPNRANYSYVANIQNTRNRYQHTGITDPIYGETGRFFVTDQNEDVPILSFELPELEPNQFYEYSFWAANAEYDLPPHLIEVYINNVLSSGANYMIAYPRSLIWEQYGFTFATDSRSSTTLEMRLSSFGLSGGDLYIDNIQLRQCNFSAVYSSAPASYGEASHTNSTSEQITLGTSVENPAFTQTLEVPNFGNYVLENIPVRNTGTKNATLHSWIDFNQDGIFSIEEYASTSVRPDDTLASLSWNIPVGTASGSSYIRFRITSGELIPDDLSTQAVDESAQGNALDGEVEDYRISIIDIKPSTAPFLCDSSLYIVIGSGAANPFSQLNRIDRSTNPFTFTPIGSPVSEYNYNALAYNPVDNYLYAIVEVATATSPFQSGEILRIGENGIPISLGQAQGDAFTYSPNAGTFLADGTYIVGRQANPIYSLDVTTSPPTAISRGQVTNTSFEDIAVNPYDTTSGRVYAIDDNTDRLVYFNINNPAAGSTPAIPGGSSTFNHDRNSQFFDIYGNLLYHSASTSNLYIVKSDGSAELLASSDTGDTHDGASCFAVGLTKDVSATEPVPAGQSVTYTYRIANSSSIPMNLTLADDLRTVGDYSGSIDFESETPVGGFYGEINAASGNIVLDSNNQVLTVSDIVVAPQSFATVTAEVVIPENAEPEIYYNQATLTGMPPGFLSLVASDYPPTPVYEDPTPVVVTEPIANSPNILLVKRVTAINGETSGFNGDNLAAYVNDAANPYDDNTLAVEEITPADTDSWPDPEQYLVGGIDGGSVIKNDEIEYTIYFLSSGNAEAKNVLLCDYVPLYTTFIPNSYSGQLPTLGDISGAELGIEIYRNGVSEYHTWANDGDSATYFPPGVDPADSVQFENISCDRTGINANPNGAIVVNLGDIPGAGSATDVATESYGYVRFRARVK